MTISFLYRESSSFCHVTTEQAYCSGGIWILVIGTDTGLNLHKRQQIICEKAVATEGKFFCYQCDWQ